MNGIPNEVICEVLAALPYKDIVRAREVCKKWKAVVENFVTLQYIVWLGIHGYPMPALGATSDTVAVRLEKLHRYERQWEEFTFSRRDMVKDRVTLQGCGSSLARIGNDTDNQDHLLLCTLPSHEDGLPPKILGPIPLCPRHLNIEALDPLADVFITLSSAVGDPLEFSVMSFKDPCLYHPRAAKKTLTCEDLTIEDETSVGYIRGDKFIYFTTINFDLSLWLIWDWCAGKPLARMVVKYDHESSCSHLEILNDHAFIMAHTCKRQDPNTFLVLYRFNDNSPSLQPRKLRTFHLPVVREDLIFRALAVEPRAMPTYTDLSRSAHPIYSDHERLCSITFAHFPFSEDGDIHCYSFLTYPSAFLSSSYGDTTDVPWESWGAKNAACFSHADYFSASLTHCYHQGNRVAIIGEGSRVSNRLCAWSLRVLDFRPPRVRRALCIAKGQPVWPAPPPGFKEPIVKRVQESGDHHHDIDQYPFREGPIRCDLPYIETSMSEEFIGTGVFIGGMDDQRIILNKWLEDYTMKAVIFTF